MKFIDIIKTTPWERWFGIALFVAAAIGGVYWGITAPAELVEDGVGVTMGGRILTIVLFGGGGIGAALLVLLLGRKG